MLPASTRFRQGQVVSERRPHIRWAACICKRQRLEALRKDAYDLKGNLVEQDCLADNIWVSAKTPEPVGMAEQHNMPAVRAILLGQKSTPEEGRDAECIHEIPGDP